MVTASGSLLPPSGLGSQWVKARVAQAATEARGSRPRLAPCEVALTEDIRGARPTHPVEVQIRAKAVWAGAFSLRGALDPLSGSENPQTEVGGGGGRVRSAPACLRDPLILSGRMSPNSQSCKPRVPGACSAPRACAPELSAVWTFPWRPSLLAGGLPARK